jgi:hypothetical protein
MTPLQLTGDGVDGVHGGPRSEAQCQAGFPLHQGETGEALRLIRYCSVNSDGLAVSCVGSTYIFADRVTESTETYEAKRSALPMPRLKQ